MNRLLPCIALFPLLSGCALLDQPADKQLATYQRILTSSSQIGATIDLRNNPGHRPAYEAALQAVESMRLSGNYDPIKLTDALAKLPIKEFNGQDGAWQITPADIVLAWDALSAIFISPDNTPPWIKATLDAVSVGITRALAASPAAMTRLAKQPTVVIPVKP